MSHLSSFSTLLLAACLLPAIQAWGQTPTENYSVTKVVQQPGYTQESALNGLAPDQLRQDIMYYDGLGRPVQQVATKQSPAQNDVVTHRNYDMQGRPGTNYLPFVVSGNGAFQVPQAGYFQGNVPAQQAPFYQNSGDRIANDAFPWATPEYEASPLKRVVRQGAPGAAWQPDGSDAWNNSDHTVRYRYRSNLTGEVRQWDCGSAPRALSSPGYYGAGQLNVLETKDENGHINITYQDQDGQVVCKKVQEASTLSNPYVDADFLVTQYVYDTFNRLRVVIQPEGMRHLPQPAGSGQLLREVWTNVGGDKVQDVPIGQVPVSTSTLSSFEAPTNVDENYGQRVRGYVTAPQTGYYTFWIASDDASELWLSTSDAPGCKRRIARVDNWTYPQDWDAYGTQKSVGIPLEAGKRYYIEAVHKEAGGGDNLAVGWKLPDANGAFERPIPGNRLSTDAITLPATFFDTYCFRYEYDERGRIIEKQVPGAGAVELVYNQRNQLILQRGHVPLPAGGWLFTKYDAQGRPVLTGQVTLIDANSTALTRDAVQQQANQSAMATWERMTPDTDLGYTRTESYPAVATDAAVLTVTYYDSYDYTAFANAGFSAENTVGVTASSKLAAGQVTGQRARVIDGTTVLNQWLLTTLFYDDEHRLVQSRRDLFPGGTERTSLDVDFLGRPARTLVRHTFPSSSTAEQIILQEFTYDHAGRLTETRQQVNNQAKLVLAHQEYNELGQLVDKKLHSPDYLAGTASQHFLQSVDYRYNIRGWLANINDRNLSNDGSAFNDADPNQDGANEDPDLFGMELMYNKNQNLQLSQVQYNGNISEVMWHTRNARTNSRLDGYSYSYDAANRIAAAPYRTYGFDQTDWQWKWKVFDADYSVSNVTYDGNGNLRSMDRKGQTSAPGASSPTWGDIDQLRYSYSGNRLLGVDDNTSTASMHDFKDATGTYTSTDEYSYDALGNLTADRNKNLESLSYNVLNKVARITFWTSPGFRYDKFIHYVYSAAGEKLQKRTKDLKTNSNHAMYYDEHTTSYAGGFVYEDNVLKFAPTSEGRMLYTANPPNGSTLNWKYEYHLKDHLGNLRFAFRADKDNGQETQRVSMEPANAATEESKFAHVAETRLADPDHARSGRYVARLNAHEGRRAGPTITLKVAAGDSIRAEVFGRYDRQKVSGLALAAGALSVSPMMVVPPAPAREQRITPPTRSRLPLLGASLNLMPQLLHLRRAALPVAYLRYEVYNQDSQLVATARQPLRRTAIDEWQPLRTRLRADSAGYVRVSVENESNDAAYFDDMQVSRTAQTPVQENHYDPFGLNLVGIEDSWDYDSQYQFNGKEKQTDMSLNWTDYGDRMYDAQLGRWHKIDSKAELYFNWSPYTYALNTPVNAVDPDGKLVIFVAGQNTGDGGSSGYWRRQEYMLSINNLNAPLNTQGNITGGWGWFSFDDRVMNHFQDHSAMYLDGALGGWTNTISTVGQRWLGSNLYYDNRYGAGYQYGRANAAQLVASLQRSGGIITESIKVVAHSMGGAYAKGLIQALVNYAILNPELAEGLSISEYDFSVFQQNKGEAVPNTSLFQYDNIKDGVVGGIVGKANHSKHATQPGAEEDDPNVNPQGGHTVFDYRSVIESLPTGSYIFHDGQFIPK